MKRTFLFVFSIITFGFSTSVSGQLQYSLDSVEFYSINGELKDKEIILEKNQDGYRTKSEKYTYESGNSPRVVDKREITYFSNNKTKESITYRCYPFMGKDTCLIFTHYKYNDVGARTYYYYRSIGVEISNNEFNVTYDFRSRDSTVFNPDGSAKTRYFYGYDLDTDSWSFEDRYEYFYNQSGERDSTLQYSPNGNLNRRTHYERFPDELKRLTTTYFSNGEKEYFETQYVLIDDVEKISSATNYKLDDGDRIIFYQSNTHYSDYYREQVYENFNNNGDLFFGGKIESYLLEDNVTADTVIFYDLNTFSGNHLLRSFNFYYYEDVLSFTSNDYFESDLVIYPNPTSDFIFLKNNRMQEYTPGQFFSIFDIKGNVVKDNELFTNRIDISNLPNGNYFIRVGTEAIQQFVVQR